MKINNSFILVFSLSTLMPGNATSAVVEISFDGAITRNYVYEEVYGVSNGPYVPSGFEDETTFHGILRYNDQAPLYQQSSSLGAIYNDSTEIELTIGDNYTVTSAGYIFVKNNYADAFDMMTFSFGDFPVDFINPADEMIYQNNFMRLEFYDDDISIFDSNEQLPDAGSISLFDRLYLRDFNIISDADSIFIDCPLCVEGETEVYPRQEIDIQGTITSTTVSVVPVPATVWLFGSGLLGLIGVARRKAA